MQILLKLCSALDQEIQWLQEEEEAEEEGGDEENGNNNDVDGDEDVDREGDNTVNDESVNEQKAGDVAGKSGFSHSQGKLNKNMDAINKLTSAYDTLCLAALSRLMQIVNLRSSVRDFVLGLPHVPRVCLRLLKFLMLTGSKGSVTSGTRGSGGGSSSGAVDNRNRGTKAEALMLLGQVIFSTDQAAGLNALHHLLWCCLSEDFELRTKVISMLVT